MISGRPFSTSTQGGGPPAGPLGPNATYVSPQSQPKGPGRFASGPNPTVCTSSAPQRNLTVSPDTTFGSDAGIIAKIVARRLLVVSPTCTDQVRLPGAPLGRALVSLAIRFSASFRSCW